VLFNSYTFVCGFLPLVLIGWWGLRRSRLRLGFLALSSYVFYAWWDWRYLPLLIVSTGVDYVAANAICGSDDEHRRKWLLAGALTVNLALLGYFKYVGFFLGSLDGIGSAVGWGSGVPVLHTVLPIGISFYTFNSMSYTIDVFRRRVAPARSFVDYAAFVAMFPHLIAGPIVRYADIEDQLRRLEPRLTPGLAASGMWFFACGLVKKLIIADTLNSHVSAQFAASGGVHLVHAWLAAVGYSLQLYFDFSGYSDMAVGLAYLLGFRFPQNFDSPFKALNISDFWRRWHMSLSFWLRDYLFIPLGGSRHGRTKTLRNLLVTMFLGGLWHGAAWTFVIWGLLHGFYLVVHDILRRAGLVPRSALVNRTLTFIAVVAAFVIFRAPDMTTAGNILAGMAGLHGAEPFRAARHLFVSSFGLEIIALLVFVNLAPNTWEIEVRPRIWQGAALGLAAGAAFLLLAQPHPFIYYQF
jgi:alginate O-acetyltransferase complex protein AlgI